VLERLSAATLRQLGSALMGRAVTMEEDHRARRVQLSDEGIEKLAEILVRGDKPTIGFYRRYLVGPQSHEGCCDA
jgi:hypothetical protein